MSDEDALAAACRARPDDDTPRLVLADWYEEHGQPERAEFIRVQCEVAQMRRGPAGEVPDDSPYLQASDRYRRLRARERALLDAHEPTWAAPLYAAGWQANSTWVPDFEWEFRRGLLYVSGPLGAWCGREIPVGFIPAGGGPIDRLRTVGHGPAIVRAYPVAEVKLTDRQASNEPAAYFRRAGTALGDLGYDLPSELFDLLPGDVIRSEGNNLAICRDGAHGAAALSTAALLWAARQPAPAEVTP